MVYPFGYQFKRGDVYSLFSQHSHGFIAGSTAQDVLCSLRLHPVNSCRRSQDLHPAVSVLGVGVHHVSRDLHKLSYVAYQKRALETELYAVVQAVTDKVGRLNGHIRVYPKAVSYEI